MPKYQVNEIDENVMSITKSDVGNLISQLAKEARTRTELLTYELAATTDASGILSSVVGSDPTNAANSSSFFSAYESYRVLGIRLKFRPLRINGGSTATFQAPIAAVVDNNDATALTGYTVAARYASMKETGGAEPFSIVGPMCGSEDGGFISTASPASRIWIKLYSNGNTASTTVGRLQIEYVVQFRGKGIN
jgi:hypothetical protein